MPAEPTFTEEQNARLRAVAEGLIERFGSQQKVADAIGRSQTWVGAFVDAKYGIGLTTAQRLAELAGKTLDEILAGGAERSARSRDPYPNRALVVEFARRAGYADAVLRQLREARVTAGDDRPAAEWVRLLVLLDEIARVPVALRDKETPKKKVRKSAK